MMPVKPRRKDKNVKRDFESYFQVGISKGYILLRDDFPMGEISPGDFKKLLQEMFRRNDEVLNGE